MKKALIVAIIAGAIAFAAALVYSAPNGNLTIPKSLNMTIGVCTHGNQSSEVYALEHGISYFRTDITQGAGQEALLSMEHSKYGASYLGILDYATLPGGISNKSWSLAEWNESVANALQRYPWIDTWEIWNEPLVRQFQTGYMNGSPYNYYMVIKGAATAIRAREPNATIVCFGGAPIGNYLAYEWYAKVWSYGAWRYCNAISLHVYPNGPALPDNYTIAEWRSDIYSYENLTHAPVWITEFGMPSSSEMLYGYTPKLQEEFLVQQLSFFNRLPFVKRVYWYDLWGLSDGNMGNNFGLLNLTDPTSQHSSAAWQLLETAASRSANK
ncbi:MAG: glycosyl hydrolase [Candidatus Micrarchaeia archaeon]